MVTKFSILRTVHVQTTLPHSSNQSLILYLTAFVRTNMRKQNFYVRPETEPMFQKSSDFSDADAGLDAPARVWNNCF